MNYPSRDRSRRLAQWIAAIVVALLFNALLAVLVVLLGAVSPATARQRSRVEIHTEVPVSAPERSESPEFALLPPDPPVAEPLPGYTAAAPSVSIPMPRVRLPDLDLENVTITRDPFLLPRFDPGGPVGDPPGEPHPSDTPRPPSGALDPTPELTADTVEVPPRPRHTPTPSYPHRAERLGWSGSVEVRFRIDEEGRVVEIDVLSRLGSNVFVEGVRKTLKSWRFEPAQHQGRPVSVWARKKFEFRREEKP